MLSSEWPLVFFTSFSQLAAGIMIAVLPFVFTKKQNSHTKLNNTALYFATGLMMVALLLSFLHLNNPVNAIHALNNLESSWLSREILFVSLFLFCLVIVNLVVYFKNPQPLYYRTFTLVTAIIGVLMIYVMAKLYILPTIPAWNSISTMIEFYSTALLIGSAFVLGLLFHNDIKTKRRISFGGKAKAVIGITLLAIVLILINALFINQDVIEGNIAFEPRPFNRSLLLIRWLALLLGAVSILLITYKKDKLRKMSFVFYLPFAFFLISELIARAAFYAAFYRIGL
ncbi:MAG: dimethyl sulfoxide reductase anchor subunit family protein [Bacteroidota bacterium]